MLKDEMVFRSVFVEPAVDAAVLAHARKVGGNAGSAYRLFLDAGLAQLASGAPLPSAVQVVPVLRTCELRVDVDDRLKALAFKHRVEEAEFAMRLARLGMLATQGAVTLGGVQHRG